MKWCMVITLAAFFVESQARSQTPSTPRDLNATEILDVLKQINGYTSIGLSPQFDVKGETIFDKKVLAAETIVFEPGGRLVLAGTWGDRGERYIVARTIRGPSDGSTPTITWQREASPQPSIAIDGKAAPGTLGGGDGADGGPGTDGQVGNPGYPGRSAPTLYLYADKIEAREINVDLRGQDGGPGGRGQSGGDGGIGRTGESAVASIFDCRAGGGNGGKGGRGGNGGRGGPGGNGGAGGTFVFISTRQDLARLARLFKVDVGPGKGGEGGLGGAKGEGGPGGQGGNGSGFCRGGQAGERGPAGSEGLVGEAGRPGAVGVFAVSPLTPQQQRFTLGAQ